MSVLYLHNVISLCSMLLLLFQCRFLIAIVLTNYRHSNDTRADLKQTKVLRPNSLHADEHSWGCNQFVRVTNVTRT